MKNLNLSDALMTTAESIKQLAAHSNIKLKITDIYTEENAEKLALLSGLLKDMVKHVSKEEINIVNK